MESFIDFVVNVLGALAGLTIIAVCFVAAMI